MTPLTRSAHVPPLPDDGVVTTPVELDDAGGGSTAVAVSVGGGALNKGR